MAGRDDVDGTGKAAATAAVSWDLVTTGGDDIRVEGAGFGGIELLVAGNDDIRALMTSFS